MAKPIILNYPNQRKPLSERFWDKVEILSKDECWLWKAGKGDRGYGSFSVKNEAHHAHRIAWVLTYGEIPGDLWVLHKCDNPPCCNPHHFFLGNQDANMKDAASKKRMKGVSMPGSKHPNSKLNEKNILEILSMRKEGKTIKSIAEIYNVSCSLIRGIISGIHWKHVTR